MRDAVLHFLLLALIVVLAVLCIVAVSWAAPLDRVQALSILHMAAGLRGEPVPDDKPIIHLASRERLCELAERPPPCRIQAFTRDDDGHIYLAEDLDFADAGHASILLHEMVHWLQWRSAGPATSCADRLQREREAYALQIHVLERVNVPALHLRVAFQMMRCT